MQAYEYVVANQGLDSDEDYPYIAVDYDPCWTQAAKRHVTAISNWTVLPNGSEPSLQAAASMTPVAVAIDASDDIFQHYKSGTLSGKCGTKRKNQIPLSVSPVDDSLKSGWMQLTTGSPLLGTLRRFGLSKIPCAKSLAIHSCQACGCLLH
eukprot:COSAG01_NODE_1715_length_9405_cov_5.798517_3_plen_151_part_00